MYSAKGIDWDAVVTHHRQLLARVVEMLFSLVIGLDEGKEVTTVPRCTRDYIYRILRPAESALRRLIMIAAREIKAPALPPRGTESKSLAFAREGAAMMTKATCCKTITVNLGLAGMGPRPNPEALQAPANHRRSRRPSSP